MPEPSQNQRRFVAYYRVSTRAQDHSGLGIDAQRAAVRDYIATNQSSFVAEFHEAVSGRRDDRPELRKALSLCRITRSTLVIARLDRLSRSVELISSLMESGLEFVVVDFPHANKFTIHILAALAEYESELISKRMKDVMATLKARGMSCGGGSPPSGSRFPPGCWEKSARARRRVSDARTSDLAPLVWEAVRAGKSYEMIAREFNDLAITPPRQAPWSKQSIARIARSTRAAMLPSEVKSSTTRFGCAQSRVANTVAEIGPLLVSMWRDGRSRAEMSDELLRRGIQGPWGGTWGPATLHRYLLHALGVASLREARRDAR